MELNETRINNHQQHLESLVMLEGGIEEINDKISKYLSNDGRLNLTTKIDGCLAPDTLVKTTGGYIPIGTIISNNSRQYIGYGKDAEGNIVKVELQYPRCSINTKKDWYTITLENGGIINCTENHLFRVNGEWISADELKSDMDLEQL